MRSHAAQAKDSFNAERAGILQLGRSEVLPSQGSLTSVNPKTPGVLRLIGDALVSWVYQFGAMPRKYTLRSIVIPGDSRSGLIMW